MKELNFLKRLSAITLAAAITAANMGFDFLPTAKKAAAEPKEENTVTEVKMPKVMTQKSKYPTSLSFIVEKNEDGESVLRASNSTVFNKYFTAELISLDPLAEGEEAEQLVFSAEGTVIRKGGNYTVNVKARINEETGKLVYNPYKIIGGGITIAEETAVPEAETINQEIAVIEDGELIEEAAETPQEDVSDEINPEEPAEIPVITEISVNICESDVNAVDGMFDMSQSQKLDYTVVKSQDSYNVIIPDDYDELFLNGIDEEGNAFFNAAGEEVQVNFNEIEMNIQVVNFAELKIKDIAEPEDYSIERFCGEEALPYYYGEIVKVTPSSGYNIVVGDMKFSDAVSVAINDVAVTTDVVKINVYDKEGLSGKFDSSMDDHGIVTIKPKAGALNGMKYTLSVALNNQVEPVTSENEPLIFSFNDAKRDETGNIRVEAKTEGVRFNGFWNTDVDENGNIKKVEKKDGIVCKASYNTIDWYVQPNPDGSDRDEDWYKHENGYITPYVLLPKDDSVKVTKFVVMSASGDLLAEYDSNGKRDETKNHEIANGNAVGSKVQEGYKWTFPLNPDAIHEDIYIDVEYEKTITFTFGPENVQSSVTASLNGNEFSTIEKNYDFVKDERNILKSNNEVTFIPSDGWKIEKIQYDDNTIDKSKFSIGTAEEVRNHGDYVFIVTLVRNSIKVTIDANSEHVRSWQIMQNGKSIISSPATTSSEAKAGNIKLGIYPQVGFYVKTVKNGDKIIYDSENSECANMFNVNNRGEVIIENDICLTDTTYKIECAEAELNEGITANITEIKKKNDSNGFDIIIDDKKNNYYKQDGNNFLIISDFEDYTLNFNGRQFFDTTQKMYNGLVDDVTFTNKAQETTFYFVNGRKIEKVVVTVKSAEANPEITEFTVEKGGTTAEQILNVLTFGIFSNDTINLTVRAKDESGLYAISDIELKNGETLLDGNFDELTASKTFTLPKDKLDKTKQYNLQYNNLTARAISKAKVILNSNKKDEIEKAKPHESLVDYKINVKENHLKVSSVDVDAVNSNDFIPVVIENVKPTVELNSKDPIVVNGENWYKGDATVDLTASDVDSGINKVVYSIDEVVAGTTATTTTATVDVYKSGMVNTYTTAIAVTTVPGEVKHYNVNASAVDNAGNVGDEKSVKVNIDAEKPVINVKSVKTADGQDYDYNGENWTNQDVTITFEVTDNNGSGVNSDTVKVNKVEYDENGNIISRIELLKPTNHENGDYSCTISPYFYENLTIYAEDNVENPFECPIGHIWTETNRPQISNFEIYKDGEKVEPQNGDYKYLFNLPAEARIQATDSDSGISQVKLKYIMADGTEGELIPTTYENNIAIFDLNDEVIQQSYYDGRFEFMAVDRAGNTTRLNEETDNPWIPHEMLVAENPEYHSGHSSAEIILPETPYSNDNPLYDKVPEITFSVKDTASGIKYIQYSINNGDFQDVPRSDWGNPQKFNVYTYVEGKIDLSKYDNENGITINLKAEDNAGNPITVAPKTISIDTTPPEIISVKFNPEGSANQEFFNKQRTATIRAKDRNFNSSKDKLSELLEVTVTNALGTSAAPYKVTQNWEEVKPIDSDEVKDGEKVYECVITFVQDAEYSFAISAEDLTTQKSQKSETFKFIIDTTAPKLSITFDNNSKSNDKYYNAGRKATLTINEHNFAKNKDSVKSVLSAKDADGLTVMDSKEIYDGKLTWTQSKTNKDEWTAQVNFNKEGTFDFSIAYTDPAGNSGNNADSGEFVIDTTAPKIEQSFTKSGNKLATNSDLVPHVIFSDYNFLSENQIGNNCKVTIRKFGENGLSSENFSATSRSYTSKNADSPVTFEQIFDIFDKEIEVDGIYEIAIRAEDLAGNVTEINDLTVSINRFGPTYMILNEEARKAVEKYAANEIPIKDNIGLEIAEVNVTPLSGKGIVRVSVDGTSINELEDGFETSENRVSLADDVWEENENGWYQTVYKIDKKNFEKDGKYRVTLESEDEAGNKYLSDSATSPRTNFAASFAVDNTEPTVIIAGADEEEYKETELELTVKLSDINSYSIDELDFDPDNKDNSTFYVKINDDYHDIDSLKKQCEGEISKDASGDIVIKMMVKASEKNQKQNIDVFIKDKAGNQTIGTESFILGNTNNWFMIIIIAAGVIILCTAVFFVTKKVRKR